MHNVTNTWSRIDSRPGVFLAQDAFSHAAGDQDEREPSVGHRLDTFPDDYQQPNMPRAGAIRLSFVFPSVTFRVGPSNSLDARALRLVADAV